ncbi:MAG: DUF1963 domain-containing protein [Novosphingobium pentaromativorans]|uniref:DUF1963 domain-containing protein n=1 Tax=Novosphingobium pentaromativorans TaxID=205844 RepID=A0A2W5R0N1_9SPHN|nr:MAG: DUF1963 domain-containing protein [Novosphingobium pentaromativorans]
MELGMKRWIALIVIIALAGAAAGYVIDAPFAPLASGAWRQTAAFLDDAAASLVALLGYGGAIAAPLVIGAVLCVPLLLMGRTGTARPLPGPVWRPEPLAEDEEALPGKPAAIDPDALLPRPVVLVRKARSRSRDWFGDSSWLGGLPKLAGIPWPRDRDGAPLPFAAQIDLAGIAAACPEAPLPAAGSLAFFVGTGAVVPVPAGNHEFSTPPPHLPPAYDEGGFPLPRHASRLSHDLFPFWPVDAVAVPLPEDLRDPHELGNEEAVENAVTAWLGTRYPLRAGPLEVQEPVERVWWHGAIHLARLFHVALDEASRLIEKRAARTGGARGDVELLGADPATTPLRLEAAQRAFDREDARLLACKAQHAALAQVVEAMDGFTADRDPWTPLANEELGVLRDVIAHVNRDCADLVRHHAPETIAQLAAFSLRAMVSGPPEALAQVSDAELARINAGYRLANRHQHEVFGPGGSSRTAHDDHRGDILLLQLAYDDMMEWNWGEMGLYQFWISPADLAARRWDRVSLTFEEG